MPQIQFDKKCFIGLLAGVLSAIFLYFIFTPFWGMNGVTNLTLHILSREKPAEPVIVCIDDQSLKKYGSWPWPRRVLSRLVDEIGSAQPKAVGLDILFVEPTPDDGALAGSFKKAGHICLAEYLNLHGKSVWGKSHISQGTIEEPVAILKNAAANVGFIDVLSAPDDTVKVMRLHFNGRKSFVSSIIMTAYPGFKLRQGETLLKIAAKPKGFVQIPASRILAGGAKDQLKGHVVLVGVTATGISDRYLTTATTLGRIPGIYLHAYTVANLLQWGSLTPIPTYEDCQGLSSRYCLATDYTTMKFV